METYEQVLAEANELRASAYTLQSEGLHALADLKMHELAGLIRAADADELERARRAQKGGH
jgi:hypothetical protein